MSDERKVIRFYKCDPKKNPNCKKTMCEKGCGWTTHKEFSIDGIAYVYNPNTESWVPENV